MHTYKLTLATATLLALVGCGGSGSSTTTPTGSASIAGGIDTGTGTATSTVDATSGAVELRSPSGSLIGIVPQGSKIDSGNDYAIIPAATPLLGNITLKGRAQGDVYVAQYTVTNGVASVTKPSTPTTTLVNRTLTGTSQGAQLTNPLVLDGGPKSGDVGRAVSYHVWLEGPFSVTDTSSLSGTELTIGSIELDVQAFNPKGTVRTTMPVKIEGLLPQNGTSINTTSHYLKLYISSARPVNPKRFTANMLLRLTSSNGTSSKEIPALSTGSSGYYDALFKNLLDTSNDAIPTGGVAKMELLINGFGYN
jgi:hypothetical protein